MAKRLTGMNITEVDLDHWQFNGGDRIHQCNRSMGIGPCIDHQPIMSAFGGVNSVNHDPFVVALLKSNIKPQTGPSGAAQLFDICQGRVPINFRLACAQQVQVWTV